MFKGNKGRKETTNPHERKRNTPNASAIKRTPRPLTLGLARDSMSIAKDSQLTNCSRVCEANYLTIFRTKQDLTAKGDAYCSKGKVKATWQGLGRLYRTSQAILNY